MMLDFLPFLARPQPTIPTGDMHNQAKYKMDFPGFWSRIQDPGWQYMSIAFELWNPSHSGGFHEWCVSRESLARHADGNMSWYPPHGSSIREATRQANHLTSINQRMRLASANSLCWANLKKIHFPFLFSIKERTGWFCLRKFWLRFINWPVHFCFCTMSKQNVLTNVPKIRLWGSFLSPGEKVRGWHCGAAGEGCDTASCLRC